MLSSLLPCNSFSYCQCAVHKNTLLSIKDCASFCNMEPMLQKERGQETCNASFLTPLSAYILCTTLFFMQCSLPYLFSFVKRFFNFSSSHVAFCRQISCSHENLPAEGYRGSATLMSKSSCAAADSIADAFLRMARGNWGTDVRKFPCSFLQADFMLA